MPLMHSVLRHGSCALAALAICAEAVATRQYGAWIDASKGVRTQNRTTMGPVQFGAALSLTNDNAEEAEFIRRGYELFVSWVNTERGGVAVAGETRQLSLTIVDDLSQSQQAREAIEMLVQDHNISLLLGPAGSRLSATVAAAASGQGAVVVLPAATNSHVLQDHSHVFSVSSPSASQLQPLVSELQVAGSSRLILLRQADSSGVDADATCASLETVARSSGLQTSNFTIGDSTAKAVQYISNSNPQIVVACLQAVQCVEVVQGLASLQITPSALILGQCGLIPSVQESLGYLLPFSLVLSQWPVSSNSSLSEPDMGWTLSEFTVGYSRLYSTSPHPMAIAAWSAAHALLAAVEAANSTDADGVANSLLSFSGSTDASLLQTMMTPINFTTYGENTEESVVALQYDALASWASIVSPAAIANSTLVPHLPPWHIRTCVDPHDYGFNVALRYAVDGSGTVGCEVCTGPREEVEWNAQAWNNVSGWLCTGGLQPGPDGVILAYSTECEAANRIADRSTTNSQDQLPCGDCQPGTYYDEFGICNECSLGTYAELSGATACQVCPAGSVASSPQSSACTECVAGTISRVEGLWRCQSCLAGTYAAMNGSTVCDGCPVGRVASTAGKTDCVACPPGQFSAWDSTQCTDCAIGMYQSQWQASACITCGTGAVCAKKGTSMPFTKRDWFVLSTGATSTEAPMTLAALASANSTASAYLSTPSPHRWQPCAWSEICAENATCAAGQAGLLCQTCEPGHSRKVYEPKCRQCSKRGPMIFFWLVGATVFMTITLWVTKWAVQAAGEVKALTVALVKMLFNYLITMSLSAGIFVLVLKEKYESASRSQGFIQDRTPVGLTLLLQFDVVWFLDNVYLPECLFQPDLTTAELDQLATYAQADQLTQLSREMDESRKLLKEYHWEGYWKYSFFAFCSPAILSVLLVLFGSLATAVHMAFHFKFYQRAHRFYNNVYQCGFHEATRLAYMQQGKASVQEKQHMVVRFIEAFDFRFLGIWRIRRLTEREFPSLSVFIVFVRDAEALAVTMLFFVYLPVLLSVMRPLYCDQPLDGTVGWRLIKWPDVPCYNDDEALLGTCVTGIIIYTVILPLLLAWRVQRTKLLQKWSLILSGYKTELRYWESLVFVRKALGVIVMAMPMDIGLRIFLLLVLSRGYSLLHTRFEPLDNRFNNILDKLERRHLRVWSLYSICIIYVYFDNAEDNSSAMVVSVGMLILHIFMILLFLRHILRHHMRHAFVEQAVTSIQRHEHLRSLVKQVRPPKMRSAESFVIGYVLEPAPAGTGKLRLASTHGFHSGHAVIINNVETAVIAYVEDSHLYLEDALNQDHKAGVEVLVMREGADFNTRMASDGSKVTAQSEKWGSSSTFMKGARSLIDRWHVRFSHLMLRLHRLNVATMPRVAAGGDSPWFAVLGRIRRRDLLKLYADHTRDVSNLVLPVGADSSLSKVELPQGVMMPTDVHRRFALGILREAFEHIVVSQGMWTFSSTLLEFVFRIPFTFTATGQYRIHGQSGGPQHSGVNEFVQGLVEEYDNSQKHHDGKSLLRYPGHEDVGNSQRSYRHVVARMLDPHVFMQSITLEDFQLSMNKLLNTKGPDLALWLAIFEEEWGRERVKPQVVQVVRISKADKSLEVGIDYGLEERSLRIRHVDLGGYIDMWNNDHPEKAIKAGDRIIAINGVRGHSARLEEELLERKDLIMEIRSSVGSSVVANLEEGCLVRVTEVTGHTRGEACLVGTLGPLDESTSRWEVTLLNGDKRYVATENLHPVRDFGVQTEDKSLPSISVLMPLEPEEEEVVEQAVVVPEDFRPDIVQAWLSFTAAALILCEARRGRQPGVWRAKLVRAQARRAKEQEEKAKLRLNSALDDLAQVKADAQRNKQELEKELAGLQAEVDAAKQGVFGARGVDVEIIGHRRLGNI